MKGNTAIMYNAVPTSPPILERAIRQSAIVSHPVEIMNETAVLFFGSSPMQ